MEAPDDEFPDNDMQRPFFFHNGQEFQIQDLEPAT
jgi:hypothetical protein